MEKTLTFLHIKACFGEEISETHWTPGVQVMINIARPVAVSDRFTWHDEDDATTRTELSAQYR
jgi:hypothetical protein